MQLSSEDNFKDFMKHYGVFENLDDKDVPDGVRIADYMVRDKVVVELKTIKSDPKDKLEDYFHEIMKRDDFPSIYGELNFRKTVSLMRDGDKLIKKFEQKAFNQIEGVFRSAKKQIDSTIKHFNMDDNTCGALVLINELGDFFEPEVLIDYIQRLLCSKANDGYRFYNIHKVVFIQSTHKVSSEQNGLLIPIYDITNDNLTLPNKEIELVFKELIESYSSYNGFNHAVDRTQNGLRLDCIIQEAPREQNGQERIEQNYRQNRYLENNTDEELIEYGSGLMSIFQAMFTKSHPLIDLEKERKEFIFRKAIEFYEECRIRPFDMKRLKIDIDNVCPT